MKAALLTILSVAILSLTGCKKAALVPESHVRAEVSWKGASAESVRDELIVLKPDMQLAVIEDGTALLYFKGDVPAVVNRLNVVKDRFEGSFSIQRAESIQAPIPSPPTTTTSKTRLSFEVDREAATRLGITIVDLSNALKDLQESPAGSEPEKLLEGKSVMSSDGISISLNQLVKVTTVVVSRPLVVGP